MFHFRHLLLPLLFVGLAFATTTAWSCPTCTQGMEHDPSVMAMARGYFWSILFMMSMPFLILGGLSTYFYVSIRRARQQAAAPAMESLEVAAHSAQ